MSVRAILIIAALVATLALLEWRSWRKPLAPAYRDWWGGVAIFRNSGRALTGGSNFDERHD